MNKKTLRDVELAGKRVVMRVDFNVPIKEGVISDDTRIRAALPSIQYVLEHGASLVLTSHLGRPKEKGYEEAFSLKPVAEHLSKLLGFKRKGRKHSRHIPGRYSPFKVCVGVGKGVVYLLAGEQESKG